MWLVVSSWRLHVLIFHCRDSDGSFYLIRYRFSLFFAFQIYLSRYAVILPGPDTPSNVLLSIPLGCLTGIMSRKFSRQFPLILTRLSLFPGTTQLESSMFLLRLSTMIGRTSQTVSCVCQAAWVQARASYKIYRMLVWDTDRLFDKGNDTIGPFRLILGSLKPVDKNLSNSDQGLFFVKKRYILCLVGISSAMMITGRTHRTTTVKTRSQPLLLNLLDPITIITTILLTKDASK